MRHRRCERMTLTFEVTATVGYMHFCTSSEYQVQTLVIQLFVFDF